MSLSLDQIKQTASTASAGPMTLDQIKAQAAPVKTPAPTPQKPEPFLTSDKPLFPASEGGPETNATPINLLKTFGNIPSSARNLVRGATDPINPLRTDTPFNIGGNIAKAAPALLDIFKNAGPIGGVKAIAGGVADTAVKGANALMNVGRGLRKEVDTQGVLGTIGEGLSKVAKTGIEDPLLIPSMIYAPAEKTDVISALAKPVTKAADALGVESARTVKDMLTKSEDTIRSNVLTNYEKGVKPLINAKMTPTKLDRYRSDVVTALKTIKENSAGLKFTADDGTEIIGKNPSSLQQLSDAVEQTKRTIYSQYDALAQEAGKGGVRVDLAPIASELTPVIKSKALEIANPKAIKYAEEVRDRLLNSKTLDAQTAQDVIEHYNASLKAFYRNPNYDTASQATIDAMIANRMRKALDDGITGLTGTEYQALKNQYASLKAIESDVVKASLRDARKNTKGLIDLTDVFSGGQIVNGIVSMNPATISQGLFAKGIASFYKFLNDPNRAVQQMFKDVEKLAPDPVPIRTARPIPLLPAPKTEFRSSITGPTIAIPKKLPSTVDASERANPSIKAPENSAPGIPLLKAAGENPIQGKNLPQSNLLPTAPKTNINATPSKKSIGVNIPQISGDRKSPLAVLPKPKTAISSQNESADILDLSPEAKGISEKASSYYAENKDKLISDYKKDPRTRGGIISNSDTARPLFSAQGYNGTNPSAVQKASKQLAADVWHENLKNNKGNLGVIAAGGSGAGKSITLAKLSPEQFRDVAAVWDGNSDTISTLKRRIQDVVSNNKKAIVQYTYAPVDEGFQGMIQRMLRNPAEKGRLVPISELVANTIGSQRTIKEALQDPELKKLVEEGNLQIDLNDNSRSLSKPERMSLEKFNEVGYDESEVLARLRKEAKDLYDRKTITEKQYQAIIK